MYMKSSQLTTERHFGPRYLVCFSLPENPDKGVGHILNIFIQSQKFKTPHDG